MKSGIFELIKRAFRHEPPLHPVDHQMAKHWIKQRLIVVFPELRNNPAALERAYRGLGLEARDGKELGEEGAIFEVQLPAGCDPKP